MGVVNKAKGLFQGSLADEPIRTVDEGHSKLPDWEPDELPEPEPKAPRRSLKDVNWKRSGKSSNAVAEVKPAPKPQRRSISDFETWTDDDVTEAPREITVDQVEEPYETLDSIGSSNEFDADDSDDEMLDNLTSLDDEPAEAWDPSTVSVASDDVEPQDSSPTPDYAEPLQTTAFESDSNEDDLGFIEDDAPVATRTPEHVSRDTPLNQLEDEMTETEFEELPDAPDKSSEELIRDHSEAPIDLSRAISLEALDQIVFPTDSNGYNRANVDAMLGFLRLSLSLYIRQADRLEKTIENLAEELERRNDQYTAARRQLNASVPTSHLEDERAESDRLAGVVKDLASRLGLDSTDLLGKPDEGGDVLVFQSGAFSPRSSSSEPDQPEAKPSATPAAQVDADEDDEILKWGSLK